MRKKIKLSFDALERELLKISSDQMLNVFGGNGDPNPNATYFTQLDSYISSKISSLEWERNPGQYNSALEDTISSLRKMRTSFNSLKSDTSFTISGVNNGPNNFSFNVDGNNNVTMGLSFDTSGSLDERMAKLGHELTHVLQWKRGDLSFSTAQEGTTMQAKADNYDKGDELEAYRNMAILQFGDSYYKNKGAFESQFNGILNDSSYKDKFTHTEYPITTPCEDDYPTTPYDRNY